MKKMQNYEIEHIEATEPYEAINDESDDESPLINSRIGSLYPQYEDGKFPKTRHTFGFMGFLGFAVVYAMRVNLSVAIVAMVNQTSIPYTNHTTDVCPQQNLSIEITKLQNSGPFPWDESTQGIVLGSFFYGYVITQVPGGRLAEIFGGKYIYGFGVLITAIFTLLTPIAAYVNLPFLVLIRVLEGMGEGVTYPAMHAMLAHWIPPLERNKFAAIVYAGANIGTVISLPLAGWLCSLEFMGGWPLAFYIFGVLGIIWFIFWIFLVYDTPSVHPRISSNEKNYIENLVRKKDFQTQNDAKNIPWASILTSFPVWAILITQCGQSWAFYTLLTELPTYMQNILHFGIQSNAFLSSLPHLTSWIFGILSSIFADWMLEKNYISLVNSYRLWNSIASIIPSIGLIGVAYVGCNWFWVMLLIAGTGAFQGAMYSGNQMNHIALSPEFAGTLYGFTNAAANICGFLAPYAIGLLINENETLYQWSLVFYLAAFLNITTSFVYLIFVSAEEQRWSSSQRRVNRDE